MRRLNIFPLVALLCLLLMTNKVIAVEVFSDDFDDGVINSADWMSIGNLWNENEGVLETTSAEPELLSQVLTTDASYSDFTATFNMKIITTGSQHDMRHFWFRAAANQVDGITDGYSVQFRFHSSGERQLQLFRGVYGNAPVRIADIRPYPFVIDSWYSVKVQAESDNIRVKVWLSTEDEPSTWDININDNTYTSGRIGFGNYMQSIAQFDNLTVNVRSIDPIAYYPFDGNANDVTGNGHDAIYNSGAILTTDRFGNPDSAYYFDGVDDYIDFAPNGLVIDTANTAYSISGWFKHIGGSSPIYGGGYILLMATEAGIEHVGPSISAVPLKEMDWAFYIGNRVYAPYDAGWPSGEWYHVAGVSYPDKTLKLYINGTEVDSGYFLNHVNSPVNFFRMGGKDNGNRYTECEVDDIRIYDRALSQSEIEELANEIPSKPDIDVSPVTYDFGDVGIGSSETMIISVSNTGDADLTVNSLDFQLYSSSDFSVTSAPLLPAVIASAGTIDVEVTFAPTTVYYSWAVLEISSDDADESLVEVDLGGVGVWIEPPPDEQIEEVLDFIDESVTDGKLAGDGPGKSADKRLNALINMIEAAGDLIRDGLFEEAYEQLESVYKKCDGQSPPPDFVTGPATEELASRIQHLMQITKGAIIVAVDGLSPLNSLLGISIDDADHYLKTALENMNLLAIKDSDIKSFTWSRDIDDTVSLLDPAYDTGSSQNPDGNLRDFLREHCNTAKAEGKKFIILSHSWGTVLSYLALGYESFGDDPIVCDLFVTLSSPMGTMSAHDGQTFDYSWEEIAVNLTTLYWFSEVFLNHGNNNYEEPNPSFFSNFWAWGDVISGPLNLPGTTMSFEPVDIYSTHYERDERTYLTTQYWHEYTKLQSDHSDNESLRNAVEDLIMQTLSE